MSYFTKQIMAEQFKFSKIVEGLQGAEGPVFNTTGDFFMVSPEVTNNHVYSGEINKIDFDKGLSETFCKPAIDGYGGIPAGCQCDRNNNIWVADMRLGLLKVFPNGQFQQVAKTDSDGNVMQGCNDCCFDYDGTLWITAPAGKIAPAEYTRSTDEPFGSLYCYYDGKLTLIDGAYRFCNGIAVQHDSQGKPRLLIVAETSTKSLWCYDIEAPGRVKNRRLWGKVQGDHVGGPDGMDFDEKNNLLVANWGSSFIDVYFEGTLIERVKCPFMKPSNLHFEPKTSTVYITEHDNHALWKFTWKYNGKPQYCDM